MPESARESTKKRARECQGRNESARESEKGPESARLGQRVPEDSKEARESQGSRAKMPQEWTLKFDRPQVSTLKIREGELQEEEILVLHSIVMLSWPRVEMTGLVHSLSLQ